MDKQCNVKLISFNCKGIKRSLHDVQSLCNEYDLIALQELWLLPDDIDFLSLINQDFGYHGISAIDTASGPLKGRPYGGVALIWRKSVFSNVSLIDSGSKRIAAIRVELAGGRSVIVLSVYMPTDSSDNLPLFTECMGKISAIVENNNCECVFAFGDYNADLRAPFGKELQRFCDDWDWVCTDTCMLGESSNAYTYKSDVHGSTSWLDHCLATASAHDLCTGAQILYDVFWSDHYPLLIECNLNLIIPKSTSESKVLLQNDMQSLVLDAVHSLLQKVPEIDVDYGVLAHTTPPLVRKPRSDNVGTTTKKPSIKSDGGKVLKINYGSHELILNKKDIVQCSCTNGVLKLCNIEIKFNASKAYKPDESSNCLVDADLEKGVISKRKRLIGKQSEMRDSCALSILVGSVVDIF